MAKQEQKAEQAAAVASAPVIQVASAAPVVKGITSRKIWKARVVDETKIPRDFLAVDTVKLDRYAKAMRDMAKVDGVEFFQEDSMAASGR